MNTTIGRLRFRIPNHVALLAAVMLMTTAAFGPAGDDYAGAEASDAAQREEAAPAAKEAHQASDDAESSARRSFRLVLFRHG